MKRQHSPEPWVYKKSLNVMDCDGNLTARLSCTTGHYETEEENARRIVACVNACAGAETDKLEQVGAFVIAARKVAAGDVIIDLGKRIVDAEAQRDELLKVLQDVIPYAMSRCEDLWDAKNQGLERDNYAAAEVASERVARAIEMAGKYEVKS